MDTTGPSLASQHEAAGNGAHEIWLPLTDTCGHLSWSLSGYQSVISHSSAVVIGHRHTLKRNYMLTI